MRYLLPLLLLLSPLSLSAKQPETEKLADDPTKVITRIGAGYNNTLKFNGSLAFGEKHKISTNFNTDLSEWRVGGSALFDVGIVNFNLSRNEYDDGGTKNNYSVGTFMPIDAFDTGEWLVFGMAGVNYNQGETTQEQEHFTPYQEEIMHQSTNYGGYLGTLLLRPITERWTFKAFGGLGRGSNDYENYWLGAGMSYKMPKQQTINVSYITSEDSFGSQSRLGVNYTLEF